MSPNKAYRVEHDLLGPVEVPADSLYGAQTQRAVDNFPVRGRRTIGHYPPLIRGLLYTKQAAAAANLRAGQLDESIAGAVLEAGQRLLAAQRYDGDFPIHHLHGGGGTSANMNVNEVLANLGEELLGGRRGEYRLVHPNDHVNLNQSTNDVYPTACHIAVILQWPALEQALGNLAEQFDIKAVEVGSQRRIARTCLQDAVAITFGDLFGGYSGFLRRNAQRIARAVDDLHAVPLGGTIVGRPDDVPPAYFEAVIPALRKATGDPAYRRSENLFDAAQNPDDLVHVSGGMDMTARGLVKICHDLRLVNSGPETGLGEVVLPAVQPGSSIMPGKVNPVIPEYAVQLCFRVMGLHAGCQAALDQGELDLNIWESVVAFGILDSMELLENAADALADRCVKGIGVNAERNDRNVQTIIPRLTDLAKRYGYSRVSEVCKEAGGDIDGLRRLLDETFPE